MTLTCKCRAAVNASSVLLATGLPLQAAKEAPKAAPEKKPDSAGKQAKIAKKGPADRASQIESQLRRSFKSWDRDKNDSVSKEDLEKFFAKFKAKPKKQAQAGDPNQPDAATAITALYGRLDSDQDNGVTATEFDAWAADFAAYVSKSFDLLDQRARSEREILRLQAVLARNGNVSAGDGFVNDELNRGVIRYEQTIKELARQLEQLDPDGQHADYRDFVMVHVLKMTRR